MKVVFHPLFILAVAAALFAGFGLFVLASIVAVLVHESVHAIVANHFGVRAKKLTLLPFGAQVNIDCAFLPRRQQVMILLAGAFGNIALILILSSFLWVAPYLFSILEMFIVANAISAVLNLLPIYPLDGGKVLQLMGGKRTAKVLKIVSNTVFGALFFVGCFAVFNWAIIILAVCMIFTINMESGTNEFTSMLCKKVGTKSGVVREVAVTSHMTIFAVYKLISHKCFTKFIITDMANRTFLENELEQHLVARALDTKLAEIYSK